VISTRSARNLVPDLALNCRCLQPVLVGDPIQPCAGINTS